jgi:hypothetical protein
MTLASYVKSGPPDFTPQIARWSFLYLSFVQIRVASGTASCENDNGVYSSLLKL